MDLVVDADVCSDPLGVHVVVFTNLIASLEFSNHIIRVNVEGKGIKILNIVYGLVIDLNRRLKDGALHDPLPFVVIHVLVFVHN